MRSRGGPATKRRVDLPGTYSLSAHSPDEQVAVDAVNGRHGDPPNMVVVVVDAGALERGLYLALQVLETGVPVVVALNMLDEATAAGADFDTTKLGQWLGATVVPTVASKGTGLDTLRDAVATTVGLAPRTDVVWVGFSGRVETELSTVEQTLADSGLATTPAGRRSWGVWSLLSLGADENTGSGFPQPVHDAVLATRDRAAVTGWHLDQEIIGARYAWIGKVVGDIRKVVRPDTRKWTERLDAVLTHRVLGMTVFAVVMALLFEALFTWSEPAIGAIEAMTAGLQNAVSSLLPAGPLRGLVVDGVIAGVGNVLVFVPQIGMLFLFIAVLEDVGRRGLRRFAYCHHRHHRDVRGAVLQHWRDVACAAAYRGGLFLWPFRDGSLGRLHHGAG